MSSSATEQQQALKEQAAARKTAKAHRDQVILMLAEAGLTTLQIAMKTEITTGTVLAVLKRMGGRTKRSKRV